MWQLLMGNAGSSEEDDANLASDENETSSTADFFGMGKSEENSSVASELDSIMHHSAEKLNLTTDFVRRKISPTREAGDGMEASKNAASSSARVHELRSIKLPNTNIVLDKLPPISDVDVELPVTKPTSPLIPLTAKCPMANMGPREGIQRSKEPRFVPYEPYKAAVTPLAAKRDPKKKLPTIMPENVDGDEIPTDKQENVTSSISINEGSPELAAMQTLRQSLVESEKQLRIQIQVNNEVKKLLVASVGEDIEAKVDYLTQDKARLAADIRQFSDKISRDFEEKEQLSVQSNLWKSKFLASSVIVDELARCKAQLMQRSDDYDHFVRLLLHERGVVWSTMENTLTVLDKLKHAFDPLKIIATNSEGDVEKQRPDAASVLGLADMALTAVRELTDRLLGSTHVKMANFAPNNRVTNRLDTPAEEGLRAIVHKSSVDSLANASDYSDRASLAVTGAARLHLAKIGDKLESSRSEFKCCTHCQGTVHNV